MVREDHFTYIVDLTDVHCTAMFKAIAISLSSPANMDPHNSEVSLKGAIILELKKDVFKEYSDSRPL